jgi:MoaA/NifB/PqqE/SkfB family radical SAM enzyme
MDREPSERQRFSTDEMGEIIETAARLDGVSHDPNEVTLDEIAQVAAELGISDEAVMAAVAERRREAEARKAEEEERREARRKRARAWRAWRAHIASYVSVMLGLVLLDLVTGPGAWWYYPAIAWGMGLGIHTLVIAFNATDDEDI